MNALALLGLLSSLYEQVIHLQQENTQLRESLSKTEKEPTNG